MEEGTEGEKEASLSPCTKEKRKPLCHHVLRRKMLRDKASQREGEGRWNE